MTEIYKVDQTARKFLFEGVQGENESRSIRFDITPSKRNLRAVWSTL